MIRLIFSLAIVLGTTSVFAKDRQYRKVQEVNFDGSDVDGKVRNPNGAYVVQRRGVDFVPLYKIRDQFDASIKESVEYLRE